MSKKYITDNIEITTSLRIDSTGPQPSTGPYGTPNVPIIKGGGDQGKYLSEPDLWITINVSGTDYVVPAYLP
jgi:hypothetical protein